LGLGRASGCGGGCAAGGRAAKTPARVPLESEGGQERRGDGTGAGPKRLRGSRGWGLGHLQEILTGHF